MPWSHIGFTLGDRGGAIAGGLYSDLAARQLEAAGFVPDTNGHHRLPHTMDLPEAKSRIEAAKHLLKANGIAYAEPLPVGQFDAAILQAQNTSEISRILRHANKHAIVPRMTLHDAAAAAQSKTAQLREADPDTPAEDIAKLLEDLAKPFREVADSLDDAARKTRATQQPEPRHTTRTADPGTPAPPSPPPATRRAR
ncbi:hypothetical protein N0X72_00920 [Streptomyces carpaticus]|uniref:hypothetical protein n=1 Tax=Streptomyces carpaticus TaxID=285558 RepID=UPI0022095708|nr:hypothetical protein N0X72_00920 [Streptomyces carpaticus]